MVDFLRYRLSDEQFKTVPTEVNSCKPLQDRGDRDQRATLWPFDRLELAYSPSRVGIAPNSDCRIGNFRGRATFNKVMATNRHLRGGGDSSCAP
jgi:hypothetical protein